MPELMKLTEEERLILCWIKHAASSRTVEYVIDRECLSACRCRLRIPPGVARVSINRQSGIRQSRFSAQYISGLVKQFYEANRIRS